MDINSLIAIIVAVVVIYFAIKFIISPIIKAVVGVVLFLILIYVLQRYFGFDPGKILSPFGISFDTSKWGSSFNWIFEPINYFIDKGLSIFSSLWAKVPKNTQ